MITKACSVYDRFKKGVCGLPVEPGFNQCQHHFADASRRKPTIEDFRKHLRPMTVEGLRRVKGVYRYEGGPVVFREIHGTVKPHYKWSVVSGRGRWILTKLRYHPEYPIHLSTYEPRL